MKNHAPINLAQIASSLPELWSPQVVAQVAGHFVKVARVQGEFTWHSHAGEDELFLVLEGTLVIEMRDGNVRLQPGEIFVVPAGVEHRPIAAEEVLLALFEPSETLHTGGVESELTKTIQEQLGN